MLVINEDLLGPEAIADPYTYYGRLREEDPIHWNLSMKRGCSPVMTTSCGRSATRRCSRPRFFSAIRTLLAPDLGDGPGAL